MKEKSIPSLFQYNPMKSKHKWVFPISPVQISRHFMETIERNLEYIWQNCEITDEPEDLDNYQGHGTGQHVSPAEVEELKALRIKATACFEYWWNKQQ